jgi:Ca-activated chloride channel family protein
MEGEKIQQAKSAARYVLSHLGPDDRFHITTFSSSVEHFSEGMSPAVDVDEAARWVDALSAGGSTDINRALLEAAEVVDPKRPTYLIFLTDGLPTVGVRQSGQIIKNFSRAAGSTIRLFPFGVGYDVDTLLLDTLGQAHHGASSYVKPGEALDQMLSAFYEKISTPVLMDLHLNINGVTTYDVFPQPLPDLFQGSQLVVSGRYRQGGKAEIILEGRTNENPQTFRYSDMMFTEESPSTPGPESSLPRIWAARKIGILLNQIRLEGNDPETVQQIVKLSIRYGIVTPYTSYLVTEPLALGKAEQEKLADRTYSEMQSMPTAPSFGAGAVQKAEEQNDLAHSVAAPQIAPENSQTLKTVGARTFALNDSTWVDTAYDPEKMTPRKVKFLSDEYFDLTNSRPDLATCFSLGIRVIVVDHQQAIEVIE